MDDSVKDYFKLDRAASVWWFPEREPIYQRQLVDLLAVIEPQGKRILDVGTGRGRFAIGAARAGARHVVAADISRKMLSIARQTARDAGCEPRISFVCADAERLPFRDASVDLANCLEVFVHLPHRRLAWLEMLRVAVPGADIVSSIDLPVSNSKLLLTFYAFHALWHHPRKVLARARGILGLGGAGPVLYKRKTIAETIEAVRASPQAEFTRPEEALERMDREEFLGLLAHPSLTVRIELSSGFRWLPHGLVVVARKLAAPTGSAAPG